MILLRRLVSFFIILALTLYVAYFSYVNTKPIHIIVPPLGELRMPAALGFLASFMLGSVFTCLFFTYEFLRKILELRSVRKELKQSSTSSTSSTSSSLFTKTKIEDDTPPISSSKPSKNLDFFSSMDDEPSLDDISTKN